MGIKGIYGEIGPGDRVALAKLAIEKLEQTGRPLRIAIDVSIWEFQIQAGQGGTNPAVRTLYYRLLRLLSLSIQPLFVFDGPNKPPMKRNKHTGPNCSSVPNFMTKQLLKLFGFPSHNAPGEAEAECALLQREGIVDAVLSEDVDTLMFGCGITFRNWSSEDSRGKTPTHVSVYDAKATKDGKSGLDREGMVLVALMSGGDYVTEGIPGCGIKLACEAARAGFGKSLCSISGSDASAMVAWREDLAYQIRTNEKGYFKMKRKTLKIPGEFPDLEALGYYTHPVVSTAAKVARLKTEISWEGEIDIAGLRIFVAEAFDWIHKTGAKKFIRGLAPALLVSKLRIRGNRRDSGFGDIVYTAINEMQLVRSICGKRVHFSTGNIPELRLVYRPLDIIGLDLDAEIEHSGEYSRNGLATNRDHEHGDDCVEVESSDNASSKAWSMSPTKRKPSAYDPSELDKIWVSESVAKIGIPLKVEDWEESQRNPRRATRANAMGKKAATKGGMPQGSLDRYVTASRSGVASREPRVSKIASKATSSQPVLPPVFLAPTLGSLAPTRSAKLSTASRPQILPHRKHMDPRSDDSLGAATKTRLVHKSTGRKHQKKQSGTPTNPWTIASSSPSNSRTVQISKPGIQRKAKDPSYLVGDSFESPTRSQSRKVSPASSPPAARKHTMSSSLTFPNQEEENVEVLSSSLAQHSSPSPKKKRPLSSVSEQLNRGPKLRAHLSGNSGVESLSSKKVNRKLSLTSVPSGEPQGPPSSPLPSLRELISQTSNPRSKNTPLQDEQLDICGTKEVTAIFSSPPQLVDVEKRSSQTGVSSTADDRLTRGKKKRLFVLRESLEGAWKEVEEDDLAPVRGRGRIWRESQVETLDLTNE